MLIFRGRLLGLWIYVGVFVATLLWAVWEVGLQTWPLTPRLVGPLVLLVLVLAAAPLLAEGRFGRRIALGGCGLSKAI